MSDLTNLGIFQIGADFEEGNLAILFPGKACQGPGQLPQPGTSSGGKILRGAVPSANRCFHVAWPRLDHLCPVIAATVGRRLP